jgi:hypothetical protein
MAAQKRNAQVINPVFTDADLGKYNSVLKLFMFHFFDFFDWWYIRMPIIYILQAQRLSVVLNDQLSILLLVSTFFTPWHRDKIFIGYFIGIIMRILYLPIAISLYIVGMTTYLFFILFWILLPLLTIVFIFLTPFL